MPLIVLAFAIGPTVHARDLGAPPPPLAVQASVTDAGTLVTWLPPAAEGASALVAYHVHRLAGPTGGWQEVGVVDAATLSFTDGSDPGAGGLAAYSVTAENSNGLGLQSAPAMAGRAMCDPLGLSGTPPQPVVNLDCLPARFLYLE